MNCWTVPLWNRLSIGLTLWNRPSVRLTLWNRPSVRLSLWNGPSSVGLTLWNRPSVGLTLWNRPSVSLTWNRPSVRLTLWNRPSVSLTLWNRPSVRLSFSPLCIGLALVIGYWHWFSVLLVTCSSRSLRLGSINCANRLISPDRPIRQNPGVSQRFQYQTLCWRRCVSLTSLSYFTTLL